MMKSNADIVMEVLQSVGSLAPKEHGFDAGREFEREAPNQRGDNRAA